MRRWAAALVVAVAALAGCSHGDKVTYPPASVKHAATVTPPAWWTEGQEAWMGTATVESCAALDHQFADMTRIARTSQNPDLAEKAAHFAAAAFLRSRQIDCPLGEPAPEEGVPAAPPEKTGG